MDMLKTDIKKLYKSYLAPSLSAAAVTSVYSFAVVIFAFVWLRASDREGMAEELK